MTRYPLRRLSTVICPKCQNMMRTVDKEGVHIDQCEGCRGIFLDHGELERIVSAENAYYGQAAAPPPYQGAQPHQPPPPPGYHGGGHHGHKDSPRPYRGGYGDSPRPYRGGYGDSPRPYGYGHKKRKRSFLDGLFD